jgi:hypothetical protein
VEDKQSEQEPREVFSEHCVSLAERTFQIDLPAGSQIVDIREIKVFSSAEPNYGIAPIILVRGNPDLLKVAREFVWAFTGEQIPPHTHRYIGTVLIPHGAVFRHLFERRMPDNFTLQAAGMSAGVGAAGTSDAPQTAVPASVP